ncbi:MAG TPA: hypothetical protein D7H76_02665 [Candidatus Poseidoniales archaeon]|nr:hypothetical protein [Euryarchaeota archaeon]DAC25804.1 MAG TPA: hypothetical protein D7H76_02665 [Candidatus Poseidoniales archaeon]DAC69639.1 MAG TPA: hypothetical protein D7I12_03575 [Candidatus Poseidoniales archaeon]HII52650.1 hypothetical protein [Candidatus Thalassarchaeaceae archaeon]|tara:strand:+ start:4140 stop:4541 length:402 start_codon:yes stop_codon:yes gene_type:complete
MEWLAIDTSVAYESGLENGLNGKGLEVTAEECHISFMAQSALREARWYHENSIPLSIDSMPQENDGARLVEGKGLSLDLGGISDIEVLHRKSDTGIEILVKGEGEHLALMRHHDASALAAAILSSGKLGLSFE